MRRRVVLLPFVGVVLGALVAAVPSTATVAGNAGPLAHATVSRSAVAPSSTSLLAPPPALGQISMNPYRGDGAGGFSALPGARVASMTLAAGTTRRLLVAGRAGVPGAGQATAVALQVTATGRGRAGVVWVRQPATGQPSTPAVRFGARRASTALTTVKLGADGAVRIAASRDVRVRLDAVGWYHPFHYRSGPPVTGAQFSAVSPRRIAGTERGRRLRDGRVLSATVTGRSGVPAAGVSAVAVSVSALAPTGSGQLVAFPTGTGRRTPVLSYASAPESQLAIVKVGSAGRISVQVEGAATHVRLTLLGYYRAARGGVVTGQTSVLPSVRLLGGPLADGGSRLVRAAGKGRVPRAGAASVLLDVTVADAGRRGALRFSAADTSTRWPTVRYRPGQTTNTRVIVPLSRDGRFLVDNDGAAVRVAVTALAWHTTVLAAPSSLEPPPAFSDPGGTTTAGGTDSLTQQVAGHRQEPGQVRRYWTRERIVQARANPVALLGGSGTDFHDSERSYPDFGAYQSGYVPDSRYDHRVGRLYMTFGGLPSSCSASLVARNVLITAAHCVVGADNLTWESGKVGSSTSRRWAADQVNWYAPYEEQGWRPLDYAVVSLAPDAQGVHAGDVAGWFPIRAGTAPGPVLMEGYPVEGWFETGCPPTGSTCRAWYNWSAISSYHDYADSGWYEYAIGGYVNGGASGGPFLQHVGGTWMVTGVVSHGDSTIVSCAEVGMSGCLRWYGRNTWSPYFNSWVHDLVAGVALS
ncbi:MAG TPA: trypsin-like serine protease [Nocardioidaceae bacterium]|nr:trypsin-like serine protease [Nocardioidaceae bacterium]